MISIQFDASAPLTSIFGSLKFIPGYNMTEVFWGVGKIGGMGLNQKETMHPITKTIK
jgi:hypothetical protein